MPTLDEIQGAVGEVSTPFGMPEDDEFQVDLTNVQSGSRTVPAGTYLAKLVDLAKGVSQNGNNQWVWDFEIVAGDHAGKHFKQWTALTQGALWKVLETCEALGLAHQGEIARFRKSDALGTLAAIEMMDDSFVGNDGQVRNSSKLNAVRPLESYPALLHLAEQLTMAAGR